jgi:hypothetical protein
VTYYVGHLDRTAFIARKLVDEAAQQGRIAVIGRHMDDGRKVYFRATEEQLSAYHADHDDDAYIVVEDADVIKVTGRYWRDLWTNAGLPWSIG